MSIQENEQRSSCKRIKCPRKFLNFACIKKNESLWQQKFWLVITFSLPYTDRKIIFFVVTTIFFFEPAKIHLWKENINCQYENEGGAGGRVKFFSVITIHFSVWGNAPSSNSNNINLETYGKSSALDNFKNGSCKTRVFFFFFSPAYFPFSDSTQVAHHRLRHS